MFLDTIAAIATPPGRGGVGIVRISGSKVTAIANKILGFVPSPRAAKYCDFNDLNGGIIDQGLAIYFQGPNSFSGEDVLELQGHGGPVVLDIILATAIEAGARIARPGEFSERAYLNDKLDLAQAEAIADLIEASSTQAAKQAINSVTGEFSKRVNSLVDQLTNLRIYVESAIDFPEEEIDFLADSKVSTDLNTIIEQTAYILKNAQQGVLLKEGMQVVIAGRPNAGKSSLLNALAAKDIAIVTDIAGTTRDLLREHIHIDGMPLHIIDTAGLRDNPDIVEKIGIEKAQQEIERADRILLVIDCTDKNQLDVTGHWQEFFANTAIKNKITVIFNKIDQLENTLSNSPLPFDHLYISAKTGQGLDTLKQHLKQIVGLESTPELAFSARRRHLVALEQAQHYLANGKFQLDERGAGELLAEDLRMAQTCLGEITGQFTSDDLLGKIFSSFCIGK